MLVGLMYTFVSMCSRFLIASIPRKGSLPSISDSIVKFNDWWQLFKVLRKSLAAVRFCWMVMVSST